MKDIYSKYYSLAQGRRRRGRSRFLGFPSPIRAQLLRGVDQAISESKSGDIEWRPDAEFFMVLNFEAMIIDPLSYEHQLLTQQRGKYLADIANSYEIREAVSNDVRLLVETSESMASLRERPYVSATSVTHALASVMEQLQTMSLQIWGPDEDDFRREQGEQ